MQTQDSKTIDVIPGGVIERDTTSGDDILKDLMGSGDLDSEPQATDAEESQATGAKGAGGDDGATDAKEEAPAEDDEGATDEDGSDSGAEEETGGAADAADDETPAFDQSAFDARMAELSGKESGTASSGTGPAGAEAGPGGAEQTPDLVGAFRQKLEAIKEKVQYEGEAEILNFVAETIEPMLQQFTQVQQMQVNQVAQTVANELKSGADMVAKAYGIRIAPEQMDQLIRRNVDLAKQAGGFTAQVVLEAFERENWKSLMAMQQQRTKAPKESKPTPKTLPAGEGASRMHRQGQKLTDDELILRDLA